VRTQESWLYLCVVVDLYSGIVVGWSMSPCQDRQLVLQDVLMALWQREAKTAVILHSDRGCQFTSEEYQRFLQGHNLICSMSTVGSCADNAAAGNFFGLLKRERVIADSIEPELRLAQISSTISSDSITRENGDSWKFVRSRI
jgi:putative transposase